MSELSEIAHIIMKSVSGSHTMATASSLSVFLHSTEPAILCQNSSADSKLGLVGQTRQRLGKDI